MPAGENVGPDHYKKAPGKHSATVIDQSRNERQKAVLLSHLASLYTGILAQGVITAKEMPQMHDETHEDLRTQRVRFLRTELELGTTFAGIALQKGSNADKKQRNKVNARKAYESVLQHLESMTMTTEETQDFRTRLAALKSMLLTLGEQV